MKQTRIAIFLLILFGNALASKVPFQLPPELMTPYGVIAPLCFLKFTEFSNNPGPLNLKSDSCLRYSQPYNDYALKNGLIGYNLENEEPGMKLPYIFYRYVGKLNQDGQNQYAFIISWSGGGTGSFTELKTMTLDKDQLKIKKNLASGDRCNGSVKDASIRNNKLEYQVNMTPFALYVLDNKDSKPTQADPFADCAVCCIGTIQLVGDTLKGIKFNGQTLDAATDDKKQACFNRITNQFGAKKKAFLNPSQLKKLQAKLNANCLKQ